MERHGSAGEAMADEMADASAALEAEVLRRVEAFRGRLGGDIGEAFDALAARLRLFERRPGEGYFSHPMALPVLDLPRWVCEELVPAPGSSPGPGLAARLAESAAFGYLHVRVDDDWLDEAIGEPGATLLLSSALFARHQALLARELPRASAFWDLFEEVWLGYADAMLLERRLHAGSAPHDVDAFRRVLGRSRPLVLPAAAALFALGRTERLAAVEELVAALAAAHQLFADLLHAEKDRALGNTTYVLFRLGAGAGRISAAELRAALYARGGFDAVVDEARRELARAERAAANALLPGANVYVAARTAYMAEMQRRVFTALFDSLLAARPGADAHPDER